MAKRKSKRIDISQFRGLVIQRASVYYPCLPMSWRASIGFEDFIQMGFELLAARIGQHDEKRGASTTVAYQIIESAYKGFLEKINYRKRAAEVVSLDAEDSEGNPLYQYAGKISPAPMMQQSEAYVSVRRLHNAASQPLLLFLDDNFFNQEQSRVSVPKSSNTKFLQLRSEFQKLATKYGVTIDLYRAAIHAHHERAHLMPEKFR